MKTAKAIRIHNYGGPEVVRVEAASVPEPEKGQVLVRVHSASVNPVDWKIRAGYLQQAIPLSFPATLGVDFSGVVESVGADGGDFKAGDEVYGHAGVFNGGSGAFAEFLVAAAGSIARKPAKVSYEEAAALPTAGVSALQAVMEHLRVSAGQKVLIQGGAGGIGGLAIQLAKYRGAYVATTAKADKFDYVKSLGADQVVDYTKQKFEDVLSGFDGVLDTIGGDTYVRSFKVLRKGGRIVSMLEAPREDLMKEYGVEASVLFTEVTTDRLSQLAGLVDQGALKVHIDKAYPLERAADALVYLEKQSPKGKVVLNIA